METGIERTNYKIVKDTFPFGVFVCLDRALLLRYELTLARLFFLIKSDKLSNN